MDTPSEAFWPDQILIQSGSRRARRRHEGHEENLTQKTKKMIDRMSSIIEITNIVKVFLQKIKSNGEAYQGIPVKNRVDRNGKQKS
jgi:hypothetical protein